MKKRNLALVFSLLMFGATAISQAQDSPALKDVFQKDFRIGAAISEPQFTEAPGHECEVALIQKHFNSITPENVLKWESVHPAPDRYNFGPGDRYVEFGVKNNMFIIGHCLIWHNQIPKWVFQDDQGNPLTRDALLKRMHDHIATVVGRYKGRIKGWDVVNEAVTDDGNMRQSPWEKIIGDDYVLKAFQFAHEADPDAELYYNDYSMETSDKRPGIIALIKKLKAQGAPISGIGIQGHYKMDWPPTKDVEETINLFAGLGLKVMITELDMDVLPAVTRARGADISMHFDLRPEDNPYPNGLPDTVQQALASRYADLFKVFVKHKDQITRVTFWGVTDSQSWLNDWPVPGRTDYPMLFNRDCSAKPAFDAVVAVGRGQTP